LTSCDEFDFEAVTARVAEVLLFEVSDSVEVCDVALLLVDVLDVVSELLAD